MIITCRNPRTGAMAGIASGVSRHVSSRFARCRYAGMAGGTGLGLYAHMVKACTQKRDAVGMTAFAGCIGDDMGSVFARCHNTAPGRVASRAVFGRALEDTAHVAGFTLHIRMCTGKRKTRSHVIEVTGLGRNCRRKKCHRQCDHCNHHSVLHYLQKA